MDALVELAALAASEAAAASRQQPQRPPAPQPPPPGRGVVQPTPQRLDKPPPSNSSSSTTGPRIVQPTPQPLPGGAAVPGGGGSRSSVGSSILVSPRQKGNPVLASIKSTPWEYSDIPSDYVLGSTTCALFLSLKYHRLHPEYIYTRIRALQNRYLLRVLLTLVDIPNHEEPLRELSKTGLVNNVTVILCWSAQEAARYLELYKSYEHASASAIRGQQKRTYAEQMVEFVTVPRSVNKTDAIALVSTFGSLREAINVATDGTTNGEERLGQVQGWGEKKVRNWRRAVEGAFRVGKQAKGTSTSRKGKNTDKMLEEAVDVGRVVGSSGSGTKSGTQSRTQTQTQTQTQSRQRETGTQNRAGDTGHGPEDEDDELDEMEAVMATSGSTSTTAVAAARRQQEEELGGGIAAALAKLRQGG
ncbi:restriction endonuclease type II-like protein [Pseudoneurospora amorphoporcata]|uniref:Restriction endonuclease type II-like protein n=1 Tax=Pseudoneurospora amorphoporcata TaxID=241081 RepID=A0AAN6NQN1_9PEZI|nr:restriction endonuclease type II-like protein [Pseudoneurospora amorphoporcata]